MNYRKVTAFIPQLSLKHVEEKLIKLGVAGMTVSKAHGIGEYRNFFRKDCMSDCSRVEIFTETDKARQIADTIARSVHQGLSTDGVIAILPVEEFIYIRDFEEKAHDG